MELQTLQYFSVIAREGSFLGAAQKLGYAQSNLSTKIKQLEKELGTELFHRAKQGVTLTEKGTVLLSYADKLLNLATEAKASVADEAMATPVLRIGAMESAAITFLPHILANFHAAHPSIQLIVDTCVSRTAIQKLLGFEVDGAFVAGSVTHPDIEAMTLFAEELVLLAPPAQAEAKDVKELLSLPILALPGGCSYRQVMESWLAEEGILPRSTMEFRSLGALLSSISAGLGVSLFPASVMDFFAGGHALCRYEIPQKYGRIPIHFIWRKKNSRNLTLEKFRLLCGNVNFGKK